MRQPLEGTVMRLYPFNNLIQGQSCLYCSLVTLQQKVRTMLTSSAWMRRGHYCTHAAMIWTWRLIEKNIHNRLVFGCIRRFFTTIIQIIQRLQVVLLSAPLSQRQPDHFPFFFFPSEPRNYQQALRLCPSFCDKNDQHHFRNKREERSSLSEEAIIAVIVSGVTKEVCFAQTSNHSRGWCLFFHLVYTKVMKAR